MALLGLVKRCLCKDEFAAQHLRKLDDRFQHASGDMAGPELGTLLDALVASAAP